MSCGFSNLNYLIISIISDTYRNVSQVLWSYTRFDASYVVIIDINLTDNGTLRH